MTKGILALLGSGETAPGMTKVHRELLSRLTSVNAVNLDTPYGFQLNVAEITEKLINYFQVSLQTDLRPLSFVNYEKSSGVQRELFREGVRNASYVFAGPGSPSYAVNQWRGVNLKDDLFEVLVNGGSVCFSSAAALTLGAFTAPIYEIYKAGSQIYWLDGLNLMELIGLKCVVIPHLDNAEGGNYDTSCCYLGAQRLEILQGLLPQNIGILGIDEHTAVLIDLEAETLKITGKGNAYWLLNGSSRTIGTNQVIALQELSAEKLHVATQRITPEPSIARTPLELAAVVEKNEKESMNALTKLVEAATSAHKISQENILLIETLLSIRDDAKNNAAYGQADQIRNILAKLSIEIRDSATESKWTRKEL